MCIGKLYTVRTDVVQSVQSQPSSTRLVHRGPSLGGGGLVGVARPPPCDHKAGNLLQQYPPESTILHRFAANNKKKIGGMPKDPHNLRFPFAQRQSIEFKQYFTAGPIKLFRKYSSNPKFDPPPLPKFIPGHGPVHSRQNCTPSGAMIAIIDNKAIVDRANKAINY